jgi:hypothetical protein
MDAIKQSQLRELVVSSLSSYGLNKGESIVICCPWHSEKNPSLHVHVGHKIIPGSFRCFGCSKSGNWNEIADKLNLPKFAFREKTNLSDSHVLDIAARDAINSYYSSIKKQTPRTLKGTEEIEDDFRWRGYNGKFYKRLGGKFYWDRSTEREYLYFPLHMCDNYQGYTLCNTDKKDPDKYKLYTEASKVCFLYDLLVFGDPIVLVEGHFDAIRLWAEGIPSTAIFGTQNWSDVKRSFILTKNPSKIIIAFDGDKPGYDASKKIWGEIRTTYSNIDIFYLPCLPDKLDPGNMPRQYINKLREMLYG